MDKINDINIDEIYDDINSSYKDLVSFTTKDLKNLPQNSFDCNQFKDCNHFKDYYNLRIKLYENESCSRGMSNNLILDNTTSKYSYINDTATLDCEKFNPQFNLNSLFTEICVKNHSNILNLGLTEKINKCANKCCNFNLRNGFALSHIIQNIGDFNKLIQRDREVRGDIRLFQKACILNRCGKFYLICNFNMINEGNGVAQKIIFKDVFPSNILLCKDNVFLNGCRICEKNICLDQNSLVLRLGDLESGKQLNVTIVGMLCCISKKINFCTISYVKNCFKERNKMCIDVSQKISNGKCV